MSPPAPPSDLNTSAQTTVLLGGALPARIHTASPSVGRSVGLVRRGRVSVSALLSAHRRSNTDDDDDYHHDWLRRGQSCSSVCRLLMLSHMIMVAQSSVSHLQPAIRPSARAHDEQCPCRPADSTAVVAAADDEV
jgi:hypothetical protein